MLSSLLSCWAVSTRNIYGQVHHGEKEYHQKSRTARSTVGYRIEEVNMNMVNVDVDMDVE